MTVRVKRRTEFEREAARVLPQLRAAIERRNEDEANRRIVNAWKTGKHYEGAISR